MKTFSYNDLAYSVEAAGNAWDIVCTRGDGKTAVVAAGVLVGVAEKDVEARARALVRVINPVGIRSIGPDVGHPQRVGDIIIVGPDVGHPNFIYWNKDSASCPKTL
ncbi:hypothetical protein [Propionivibrio dicarboxylicus]|uniref:Uncharacterized protein n=1 Tax=Propionivibrio dicarboxylicus TaxID=83767 RepID=A0A1G8GF81_9RHOO|nr:hypothetical protein [Propionivibrio dicarboxylicus]SDH92990.1 hypothetical protein SAMN05660652_02570 [Propionivibrio dicarboxylicus]